MSGDGWRWWLEYSAKADDSTVLVTSVSNTFVTTHCQFSIIFFITASTYSSSDFSQWNNVGGVVHHFQFNTLVVLRLL